MSRINGAERDKYVPERLLKKDEDDADGEATDDRSGDSFKSTEKPIVLSEFDWNCDKNLYSSFKS